MLDSFSNGLNESAVSNYDETHKRVSMDDRKVLYFWGTRYQEVSSGGVGFTAVISISGGPEPRIENPFLAL